jgi:hypothetical protein
MSFWKRLFKRGADSTSVKPQTKREQARERAKRAWATNETMHFGSVSCDRCGSDVPKNEGYVIISTDPDKREARINDLLCNNCFDDANDEPWDGPLPWEGRDSEDRAREMIRRKLGETAPNDISIASEAIVTAAVDASGAPDNFRAAAIKVGHILLLQPPSQAIKFLTDHGVSRSGAEQIVDNLVEPMRVELKLSGMPTDHLDDK